MLGCRICGYQFPRLLLILALNLADGAKHYITVPSWPLIFVCFCQLLKIREKADKGRKDMGKAKDNYEQCLKELNALTPRYMDDMNVVFRATQDLEDKRLKFFKKTLLELQALLDVSKNQKFVIIF